MNFLRIRCLLHCSWRVQASRKVECTNQSLKYWGTQLNLRVVLPESLLEAHESWHSAPDLSSLECFMGTFSCSFSFVLLKRKKKTSYPSFPSLPFFHPKPLPSHPPSISQEEVRHALESQQSLVYQVEAGSSPLPPFSCIKALQGILP